MIFDRFFDGFMSTVMVLCGLTMALLLVMLGHQIYLNCTHNCTASHMEHIEATMTFLPTGNGQLMPVYHPAYDTTVCDHWEPK